jgi:hypothetical protein
MPTPVKLSTGKTVTVVKTGFKLGVKDPVRKTKEEVMDGMINMSPGDRRRLRKALRNNGLAGLVQQSIEK